jgi:tetratricopeptide (TPR) repeat protein
MAEAYARILFGFLRDTECDPSQPFYIVELGSGPGRLGYLVHCALIDRLEKYPLKNVRIKYVLTDFTRRNVDYWRGHGWLQTFIEQGTLDMARFDAEHDEVLRLDVSGETLSPKTLRNPLAVIANYVFDGIPQDAFRIEEGRIYETLLDVSSPRHEPDLSDPDILARAELQVRYEPIVRDYYEDPEWNEMLLAYSRRLPAADVLFPVAALRCISNLDRLSGGRLLLLSADRGYSSDKEILEGAGTPDISRHGSFSLAVDYQLIGEYFRQREGLVLHPQHRQTSINVSAFVLGDASEQYSHTRMAYDESIGSFGPDDLFVLKEGVEGLYDSLTLEQVIAFLRLSAWDYLRFRHCLPVLRDKIQNAKETGKQALCEAIQNTWRAYFPIGEQEDLAFQMGSLLQEMGYYAEALEFFTHSVGLYGQEYGTILNMGICYYSLNRRDLARDYIDQALELYPESDTARYLRMELENEAGAIADLGTSPDQNEFSQSTNSLPR